MGRMYYIMHLKYMENKKATQSYEVYYDILLSLLLLYCISESNNGSVLVTESGMRGYLLKRNIGVFYKTIDTVEIVNNVKLNY